MRTWKNPGDPPGLHTTTEVDVVSVEVELITPMLGGGVGPRVRDPVCWVRPPSVKGQLRFWWRALYAQNYPNERDLRDAEGKLFGLPASFDKKGNVVGGPGVFSLTCSETTPPQTREYPRSQRAIADELGDIGYLLFPAHETRTRADPKPPANLITRGARARVSLTFAPGVEADRRAQVVRAFEAWLLLGGVGSRTRRGIGAIATCGAPPTVAELKRQVAGLCAPSRSGHDHVFFFAGRTHRALVGAVNRDSIEALKAVATAWKAARQDRARPRADAQFGRSRWPEGDTVRRITRTHAVWADGTAHQPTQADGAPRARLGLPIGVQFIDADLPRKDDERGQRKLQARGGRMTGLDPNPTEIKHEQGDRFASPIVFSVARVQEGYVPVVIATRPTLPYKATLNGQPLPCDMKDEAILDRVLQHFTAFEKVFPR